MEGDVHCWINLSEKGHCRHLAGEGAERRRLLDSD